MTHLKGKRVRWVSGPNVLVGVVASQHAEGDELFLCVDGLMHAHILVPSVECEEAE